MPTAPRRGSGPRAGSRGAARGSPSPAAGPFHALPSRRALAMHGTLFRCSTRAGFSRRDVGGTLATAAICVLLAAVVCGAGPSSHALGSSPSRGGTWQLVAAMGFAALAALFGRGLPLCMAPNMPRRGFRRLAEHCATCSCLRIRSMHRPNYHAPHSCRILMLLLLSYYCFDLAEGSSEPPPPSPWPPGEICDCRCYGGTNPRVSAQDWGTAGVTDTYYAGCAYGCYNCRCTFGCTSEVGCYPWGSGSCGVRRDCCSGATWPIAPPPPSSSPSSLPPSQALPLLHPPSLPPLPAATTFSFTGSYQTYVVPPYVGNLRIDAYGASGGNGYNTWQATATGGLGGHIAANVSVTPGTTLYVLCGGAGANRDTDGSCGPYLLLLVGTMAAGIAKIIIMDKAMVHLVVVALMYEPI